MEDVDGRPEEIVEVGLEAVQGERHRTIQESADLLYHLVVLLTDLNASALDEGLLPVLPQLSARHQAMEEASKLGAAMKLAAAIAVMLVAIAIAPSSEGGDALCGACVNAGKAAPSHSLTARRATTAMPQLY